MKLNHPAQIRLDTVLENCIFYISPMYEFSHGLGQKPTLAEVCFATPRSEFRTPCHQAALSRKVRMRAMLSVRPRSNIRQAPMTKSDELAAYRKFTRGEWAALRSSTPLTLSDSDLAKLRGLNEPIALDEVVDIHLPLSRLLNLHVAAARNLGRVRDAFLGRPASSPPYIIALAGSPAVGKSTFARVLRAILARWPDHPEVELVSTDGFLHPTRVLEERRLPSKLANMMLRHRCIRTTPTTSCPMSLK